ncbi:MAG: hypothetical protein NTZ07_01280 [Candidatus Woesebacteria bacterium]|nr:hypothetical protein [Candidatus Woesebacteria bacterium]
MSADLLQTETGYEFKISSDPLIWCVPEQDPQTLSEQKFIEECLTKPPTETVEDVSAVAHETNRIPDPRILIIKDGKILRLDGIEADASIEKESYLGNLEYTAFREIKRWANTTDYGGTAWFSAPFPEDVPIEKRFYPVSKIDLGTIRCSSNDEKILLKRAILLDIDSKTLLSIFNNFASKIGAQKLDTSEQMRSSPIPFREDQLSLLLEEIAVYTNQVQQVENGEDLKIKLATYSKLETIYQEIHFSTHYSHQAEYIYLRRRAEEERMIGDKSESCPGGTKTISQTFSEGSETSSEVKILNCTCPSCHQKVEAIIFANVIHCPKCGATAPYVC